MGGGKGVAPGGFCFKKVEGSRATLHDNRKGFFQSCLVLRSSGTAYTEKFEVITDHIALTLLLAMRDPKD
jgi:hypothetical protein